MKITKSVMAQRVETDGKGGFTTENEIHQIGSDSFPFDQRDLSVGLNFEVASHEFRQQFEFTTYIQGPDGQKIPMAPVNDKMMSQVTMKMRPSDMGGNYDRNLPMVMSMSPLTIPAPGAYKIVFKVNRQTVCEVPFEVVDHSDIQLGQGIEVLNITIADHIEQRQGTMFDIVGAHFQLGALKFPTTQQGLHLLAWVKVPPVIVGKTFQIKISFQDGDGNIIGEKFGEMEIGEVQPVLSPIIPIHVILPDMTFHNPGVYRFEVELNGKLKSQIPYELVLLTEDADFEPTPPVEL